MNTRKLSVIAATGLLVAAAIAAPVAAQDKAPLKVGISLPLNGLALADGGPTRNGALLAIDEANKAGGIGGYQLEPLVLDHAKEGKYNELQGSQDMQNFAGDPTVIGVVGPYNSGVAKVQIPIGNVAGLLQCSPANTNEHLTKPPVALDYRQKFPLRINYIRVASTDDVQGPAMSVYAINELGLKNVAVINDVTTFGYGVAANFESAFKDLGGTVAYVEGAPPDTTDFNGIIASLPGDIDGIYYGGVVSSGGGLLLKQMRQQGLTIPFLGPDGIVNGSGAAKDLLINVAAAAAADNSYGTLATIGDFEALGLGPRREVFVAAYNELFKDEQEFQTPGAYSAAGYACTTVILDSLKGFLADNPDADLAAIREGVRAFATDPANVFDTVLGTTSFDGNGDIAQKFISYYKVDPTLLDGAGDWAFIKQQDFGAPVE